MRRVITIMSALLIGAAMATPAFAQATPDNPNKIGAAVSFGASNFDPGVLAKDFFVPEAKSGPRGHGFEVQVFRAATDRPEGGIEVQTPKPPGRNGAATPPGF